MSGVITQIRTRPENFKWVLLEHGVTPEAMKPVIRDECHRQGLLCGIWDPAVEFDSATQVADGFDCWVGQTEGPDQYARCLQNIPTFRLAHPVPYPAAIVTNFGGLETADKAAPFINAGFFCITEAHIGEGDGVDKTEDRLRYASNVLGWPGPQPMAGLGGGVSLSQYTTLQQHAGWSVFAAEELLT